LRASEFPNAPAYCRRFAGYELAKCPARERKAYDLLHALFKEGGSQLRPSLIFTLQELEKKLDIPPADRIEPSVPTQPGG